MTQESGNSHADSAELQAKTKALGSQQPRFIEPGDPGGGPLAALPTHVYRERPARFTDELRVLGATHDDHVIPNRQIRAVYDADTIRVYQAFSDEIADSTLAHGTFVSPPFKLERMTWIKPSFLWMMYRAGWGLKDEGQKRILAIDITREGFEWALSHSCPSHPSEVMSKEEWATLKDTSPVRIQWDPERNLHLQPLQHRAIQIGLSKEAVRLYVNEWTRKITEVTTLAHEVRALVQQGELDEASSKLPVERAYPDPQAT